MAFQFLGIGWLSWITFLPIIGMIIILLIPKEAREAMKWTAVGITFLQVVIAVLIYMNFNYNLGGINTQEGMQFVEKAKWIDIKSVSWFGRLQIEYFLGVDGVSVPMVILTALISFIAVFASWNIDKALKGYMVMLLLLDTGMMGVFVSLDFFLFYVFWEVMLLPMYFLIGVWGGPRREYAAIKFFLYTLVGSVLILLAMIALYFSVTVLDPATGEKLHTFNMLAMMNPANFEPGSLLAGFGTQMRTLAYLALFIGFAIKVPIFPFHTWLPDAHVEAPTAISVILAGVLLKMGTYGLIRISFPIFPELAAEICICTGNFCIYQYCIRCIMRNGAKRFQETYRLLQHKSYGNCSARYVSDEYARYDGCGIPNVQSRHNHSNALLNCWCDLRPCAYTRP